MPRNLRFVAEGNESTETLRDGSVDLDGIQRHNVDAIRPARAAPPGIAGP
jgi:hypothetical protein